MTIQKSNTTAYDLVATINIDDELSENINLTEKNIYSCVIGIATYNSNAGDSIIGHDEPNDPIITVYRFNFNKLTKIQFSKAV